MQLIAIRKPSSYHRRVISEPVLLNYFKRSKYQLLPKTLVSFYLFKVIQTRFQHNVLKLLKRLFWLCPQQLTKVSSQSEDWFRNSRETKRSKARLRKVLNIHLCQFTSPFETTDSEIQSLLNKPLTLELTCLLNHYGNTIHARMYFVYITLYPTLCVGV